MASLYLTSKVGRVLLFARVGFGSCVAFLNCNEIIGLGLGGEGIEALGDGRSDGFVDGCLVAGFVLGLALSWREELS